MKWSSLCGAGRIGCLRTRRGTTLMTPAILVNVRKGDLHGLTPDSWERMGYDAGLLFNPFDLCDAGACN